eukprot:3057071-Alexandrium_andersonii.AAC.1
MVDRSCRKAGGWMEQPNNLQLEQQPYAKAEWSERLNLEMKRERESERSRGERRERATPRQTQSTNAGAAIARI